MPADVGKGKRPVAVVFHEPFPSFEIQARFPFAVRRSIPLEAGNRIFEDCQHKILFRMSAKVATHGLLVLMECEHVNLKQRGDCDFPARTSHRVDHEINSCIELSLHLSYSRLVLRLGTPGRLGVFRWSLPKGQWSGFFPFFLN